MDIAKLRDKTLESPPELLASSAEQRASFSELYRQNFEAIYYYLLSRVRETADAEDLTSQTFISAYEAYHRLRDPQKARSWLFSIARNKSIDFFRRRSRQAQEPLDEEALEKLSTGSATPGLELEHQIHLAELINALEPKEQEYIQLRLVANLRFAEIARILRQPETRVKKTYYRILGRLQTQAEEK